MLEPGTIIKIKSATEIDKTLNANKRCKKVYFISDMYQYCGYEYRIKAHNSNGTYRVREEGPNHWNWLPEWFDIIKVSKQNCLNDGSIEQRSLCLALCRQVMSGNQPYLPIFKPHDSCNTKNYGGFDYDDFPEDEWYLTTAKNFPDWPCLKLKPEILETALKHSFKYRPTTFSDFLSQPISRWFQWDKTPEGQKYWQEVNNAILDSNIILNTTEITLNKSIKKEEKHENQLQRKKSDLVRGTVPEGNIICGRKRKASVSIGHLSNKICSGI